MTDGAAQANCLVAFTPKARTGACPVWSSKHVLGSGCKLYDLVSESLILPDSSLDLVVTAIQHLGIQLTNGYVPLHVMKQARN